MMNRDAAIRVNTGVLSAAASMAVLCCGLFMCATSALGQAANAPADDAALAGRWRVRLTWPTGHPEDHRQAALRQTYRIPAWDFAGGPTFSRFMPSADSPAWEVARGLGGPDLGPTLEFTTWTLAPTDGALRLTMSQSLMFADGPGAATEASLPAQTETDGEQLVLRVFEQDDFGRTLAVTEYRFAKSGRDLRRGTFKTARKTRGGNVYSNGTIEIKRTGSAADDGKGGDDMDKFLDDEREAMEPAAEMPKRRAAEQPAGQLHFAPQPGTPGDRDAAYDTRGLRFADPNDRTPASNGPGWTPPAQRPCTLCNGTGYHGRVYVPGYMGERGSYVEKPCPTCGGLGYVEK